MTTIHENEFIRDLQKNEVPGVNVSETPFDFSDIDLEASNCEEEKEMNTITKKECKIDWKKLLRDVNNIKELLAAVGIDEYELVNIITNYVIDNRRYGLIVIIKNKDTGNLSEIIIDAMSGKPSWSQLMDCTFDLGRDCEKRIILYALNHAKLKQGYRYDAEMATGFANINNDCNVATYIVRASGNPNERDNKSLIYDVEVKPGGKKRMNYTELPTKEEFEQAEFGIYYNYTIDWDYDYINRKEDWFNNYWHMELNKIDFKYPVWNQEGLFMHCESTSELGVVTIKWLLDSKMELFKRFFNNSDIRLQIISPTSHVISIKLWDRPFSDFIRATTEEKENLAIMIRKQDSLLFEFWQEIFDKGKSDNEIIDYLDCLPQHAFFKI